MIEKRKQTEKGNTEKGNRNDLSDLIWIFQSSHTMYEMIDEKLHMKICILFTEFLLKNFMKIKLMA